MKDNRGSISIMVSLILLAFMTVVFFCIDGVRIIYSDSKIKQTAAAANEHVLAYYHKELQERYHLFLLDPAFIAEKGISEEVSAYFNNSICSSQNNVLYPLKLKQVSVIREIYPEEEKLAPIKHQIREYMKYRKLSDWKADFTAKLKGLENKEEKDKQTGELLDEQQKEVESQQSSESQITESENAENQTPDGSAKDPRETVKEALKGGVLNFVLPKNKSLSGREISGKSLPSEQLKNMETASESFGIISFASLNFIKNLSSGDKVSTALQNITTEGTSISYIMDLFSDYANTEQEEASRLKYEIEYIIQGKKTDKENLEGVVNKIILFRFGSNFSYALTSASLNAEALTVAAAISGLAGLPPITAALKTMILAALSYGESMLDVRSLMAGNKIPILKNETNWTLSISGIGKLLKEETTAVSDESGMEYEDFLKLFLLTQTNKELKYGRMLDLMQENIRIKEEGFSILEALFGYEIYCQVELKSLFGNGTKTFELNRSCSY